MVDKIKIPTFLKWAGGKRKIIDKLEPLFPQKIERYFEPFLGGGFVFFYIKSKYNPKKCVISDVNRDLINTYISVRDHPITLLKHLKFFKDKHSKEHYYLVRDNYNKNKYKQSRRSAAFIYLNKTCFNGLYRVNMDNKFNVPFGEYKNPEIYNRENITLASKLLQGVKICAQDYRCIMDSLQHGDFVYLDPCYDPLKKSSFVSYTPKKFCELDRIKLANFMRALKNKDVHVVLSNNDLPEIREMYSDFQIKEINALRSINSNGMARGEVKELVICTP